MTILIRLCHGVVLGDQQGISHMCGLQPEALLFLDATGALYKIMSRYFFISLDAMVPEQSQMQMQKQGMFQD